MIESQSAYPFNQSALHAIRLFFQAQLEFASALARLRSQFLFELQNLPANYFIRRAKN